MTDEEFLKAIAREICKERRRMGYTQQEIYDATGIHIGRIENNCQSILFREGFTRENIFSKFYKFAKSL